MQAPSTGTRGIVQSLTWRWQGRAAVPDILDPLHFSLACPSRRAAHEAHDAGSTSPSNDGPL